MDQLDEDDAGDDCDYSDSANDRATWHSYRAAIFAPVRPILPSFSVSRVTRALTGYAYRTSSRSASPRSTSPQLPRDPSRPLVRLRLRRRLRPVHPETRTPSYVSDPHLRPRTPSSTAHRNRPTGTTRSRRRHHDPLSGNDRTFYRRQRICCRRRRRRRVPRPRELTASCLRRLAARTFLVPSPTCRRRRLSSNATTTLMEGNKRRRTTTTSTSREDESDRFISPQPPQARSRTGIIHRKTLSGRRTWRTLQRTRRFCLSTTTERRERSKKSSKHHRSLPKRCRDLLRPTLLRFLWHPDPRHDHPRQHLLLRPDLCSCCTTTTRDVLPDRLGRLDPVRSSVTKSFPQRRQTSSCRPRL